jgi:hypothetical protein
MPLMNRLVCLPDGAGRAGFFVECHSVGQLGNFSPDLEGGVFDKRKRKNCVAEIGWCIF